MKKFSIPGYFSYFDNCKQLIEYALTNPKYFYKDRIIDSSYDLPAGLLWNGGRLKQHTGYSLYELKDIMTYYISNTQLNLNHTCTNLYIDETLTHDWFCNLFLTQYYRPQDSIILSSDALYTYLKEQNPETKIIWSTTLGINEIETINEITKTDMYVVNYIHNNENEYLKQLQHPEKIEIICAEPCQFMCANRRNHYEEISRDQLGLITDYSGQRPSGCPYNSEGRTFYEIQQLPHAITNERIDELNEMGFEYFKISGRTINPVQWIKTMCYYLVLPEYRDQVEQELINIWFNNNY